MKYSLPMAMAVLASAMPVYAAKKSAAEIPAGAVQPINGRLVKVYPEKGPLPVVLVPVKKIIVNRGSAYPETRFEKSVDAKTVALAYNVLMDEFDFNEAHFKASLQDAKVFEGTPLSSELKKNLRNSESRYNGLKSREKKSQKDLPVEVRSELDNPPLECFAQVLTNLHKMGWGDGGAKNFSKEQIVINLGHLFPGCSLEDIFGLLILALENNVEPLVTACQNALLWGTSVDKFVERAYDWASWNNCILQRFAGTFGRKVEVVFEKDKKILLPLLEAMFFTAVLQSPSGMLDLRADTPSNRLLRVVAANFINRSADYYDPKEVEAHKAAEAYLRKHVQMTWPTKKMAEALAGNCPPYIDEAPGVPAIVVQTPTPVRPGTATKEFEQTASSGTTPARSETVTPSVEPTDSGSESSSGN